LANLQRLKKWSSLSKRTRVYALFDGRDRAVAEAVQLHQEKAEVIAGLDHAECELAYFRDLRAHVERVPPLSMTLASF
jgi:hypothetical protein